MSKHTPGPWTFELRDHEENLSVCASDGSQVVGGCGCCGSPWCKEPNARLIAAAPDLLEFAEEVCRTGDTRLASMAIAVIAKATGGQ